MVSPPAPVERILLELEYITALERHTMRIHARGIDRIPVLPGQDYSYLTVNSGVSAELRVMDSLSNLAAQWAQYYATDWTLVLRSAWALQASRWTAITPLPLWPPVIGALVVPQVAGAATIRRVFRLGSVFAGRRRFWLRQLPPGAITAPLAVTPTSGGLDVRDQHLIGYLSGDVTALLAPDGEVFIPAAVVQTWWDRPRAFPWTPAALA
jgi:hypothetical protein